MFETEKLEFRKWLENYSKENLQKEDITFINLLISNFDEIAKKGTASGARAKFIVEKWNKLNYCYSEKLLTDSFSNDESEKQIESLSSLEVESFRGFSSIIKFSFNKPCVLFYGTNGSGKSSLCQALEYSLLGTIQEADVRRIELNKFIKNDITGTSKYPILKCQYLNDKDNIDDAKKNYEKYRFAFIEKNRIDSFSHLNATTTKEKNERLAALFGLSGFSAFIKEFTDSIDRYIDISTPIEDEYKKEAESVGLKKEEIKKKEKDLANLKKTSLARLKIIEEKTIDSLAEAIKYLQGEKNDGYISTLQEMYEKTKKHIYQSDWVDSLVESQNIISKEFDSFKSNQLKITKLTVDSDFHELYTVINSISQRKLDYCPACKTPLEQVSKNPFELASVELNNLQQYDNLKQSITKNIAQIKKEIRTFNDIIFKNKKCIESLGIKLQEYTDLYELNNEQIITMFSELDDSRKINSLALANEKIIKDKLCEINKNAEIENEDNDYLKKFNEYSKLLTNLLQDMGSINSYEKLITSEQQIITDFETKKSDYETRINSEKTKVNFNSSLEWAYNKILSSLKIYIKSLPIEMSKNLSKKVTEYYNIMNSDDAEFEKVIDFILPIAENDKIIIKTKDNIEDDALQILSEGHVKLLGLAILLAKAQATEQKFLIFDDIVNAIDDEHRDGVAELLLTNNDFTDKQIIITCHSEQFIRKLESKIDISLRDKKMIRYHFVDAYNQQERGIAFDYSNPKEPIELAKIRLKDGDFKDAASKCRQATESIINQFWKKLNANYGIVLEVSLRKPGDIPELASVTDSLIKKLGKMALADGNDILTDLKKLKSDYNWFIQNKGTHFEDNQFQFEAGDVRKLIELLEKINHEIMSLVYTKIIALKEI